MSGLSPLKRMDTYKNPKTGKRHPIPKSHLVLRNNKYQVFIDLEETYEFLGQKMMHLSIKRIDRKPIRDWADLQWLKNQIAGEEAEAVEIFPAESRMMDAANQYHLWVIDGKFPFGVDEGRHVLDYEESPSGARQRKRQGAGKATMSSEEAEKLAEELREEAGFG